MNKNHCKQENIRLGTHGEDYGSWMSNPVFYIIGGIGVLAAVLAVLSFYVLHVVVPGVLFTIITIALLVLLIWITWIRRQYAFGGGGIMEQVHRVVLSHLDYDGEGKILDKTTPRLIQFHILKNAVNPPFLGGFLIFGTVAA